MRLLGQLFRLALGAVAGILVVAWCRDEAGLDDESRSWAVVGIVAVSMGVALVLPAARRLLPSRGILALSIAATALAMYACVPETDQFRSVALVVGGLIVAAMLLGRWLPLVGYGGVALVVMWAGTYGTAGRQSALVGALFAWWPVLFVPLVAALRPAVTAATEPWRWAIAAVGVIAAGGVARTGALEPTAGPAWTAVAVAVAVSLAIAVAIATAARPARPPVRLR